MVVKNFNENGSQVVIDCRNCQFSSFVASPTNTRKSFGSLLLLIFCFPLLHVTVNSLNLIEFIYKKINSLCGFRVFSPFLGSIQEAAASTVSRLNNKMFNPSVMGNSLHIQVQMGQHTRGRIIQQMKANLTMKNRF